MHAHTPPFTKPEAAYDSRRLYEETSEIAAAQDAKRETISNTESKVRTALSYLHHAQLLLKEVFPDVTGERAETVGISRLVHHVPHWDARWGDNVPAESSYIARFGARMADEVETAMLHKLLTAERLLRYGIGDVTHTRHPDANVLHAGQHPMNAETLRDEYERGDRETGV